MAIFQNIPVDKGGDTIRAAQKEIINRANANHLTTDGWSLAELRPDQEDVDWLHHWARALDEDTANRWISPGHTAAFWGNPQTRRVGIGVLLMLLAAEQVRKADENEEGWAQSLAELFQPDTQRVLFKDGAPSPPLIGSMKEAAHRLRLRVNEEDDWKSLAAMRETLVLQIGLTEADLGDRMLDWLNNHDTPKHVAVLLDPVKGSDSFLYLWQSCREFLLGYQTEAEFRQTLATSVWVLARWIDSIIATLQPLRQQESAAPSSTVESFAPSEDEDIFSAFMPYGGVKTIVRAVSAVLARVDQLGIHGQYWSPSDLQIGDYDYAWLRVWVTRLDPETVSYIAENEGEFAAGEMDVSLRAGLGAMLALWIAESARRGENGEDDFWTFIASESFKPQVAAELFRENQPSSFLRVLLADAARELHLRDALPTTESLIFDRW
ncbi:MAG TPA: hypothetical protein VGB07_00880 [Blastocatellia bacterium]|jgi:hypothetical protein